MSFKLFALIILSLCFVIELIEIFIHIKQSKKPLPEKVQGIYDENEYEKFKLYSKAKLKLKISSTLISFVVLTLFLIFNIHTDIFNWAKNGYLFIFLYLGVQLIINLPFSIVNTFKIETKFGFNTSKVKTFIFDELISLVLTTSLLCGILALCEAFYSITEKFFPLIISGIVILFMFLFNFIYPLFLRIYNKFTPLEGELRDKLESLVQSYNYKVKDISICDASKRTTKLNAYCAGIGKLKKIAIYDNLMQKLSDDEIVAIFSHELAHAKHKDIIKNFCYSAIVIYIIILVSSFVYSSHFFKDFYIAKPSFAFLIVIFLEYFSGLFGKIISPIISFLSRQAEYRADRFACKAGYGLQLSSALTKLSKENLSDLNPDKLNIFLNYSHPPLYERLRAIEANTKHL